MKKEKQRSTSSQTDFDAKAGEAAFKQVEDILRAMPAEDVWAPNADVQASAVAALALVALANDPKRKARFALLPNDLFADDTVSQLERTAWAAWYLQTQMRSESAATGGTKVDPATYEESGKLLNKMLALIEYHVGDRDEVSAEIADIRSGSGYQDRASDLVRTAALWEQWREELADDKRRFDPEDARKAREYAETIVKALGRSIGVDTSTWANLRNRAWRRLNRLYEEVRTAGVYLYRSEPAERDRFVALRQVVSPSRGRAKPEPAEEFEPEAPPPSAPPPPAEPPVPAPSDPT